MNKWLTRIRTELLEIYGESYPRFVRAEIVNFASLALIILLFFLSNQPYVIRIVGSWSMVGIIVIILSIDLYMEFRYKVKLNQEMKQKYKQTVYYRWVDRVIRVVLCLLTLLNGFIFKWPNPQPQPISQAVSEYGYPVYLPTQLPFKPTKQYAVVKASLFIYDMDVFYENGDTQLNVYISKDDEEDLSLANATLKNGTKADYSFDSLSWYQNGFRYKLTYSPSMSEPKKEILLNIANSFKPVQP